MMIHLRYIVTIVSIFTQSQLAVIVLAKSEDFARLCY